MSNNKKRKPIKLKLGSKSEAGYKYSSKIDFREDLGTQISRLIREKKANDNLEEEIENLKKEINKFSDAEKGENLNYYHSIGKKLLFIDREEFKDIAPYSVYRRIVEDIPEILPNVTEKKRIGDHLVTMYKLAHIQRQYLNRASWEQWYEIMKFKGLSDNQRLLKKALNKCKTGTSGPSLRKKIKLIIQNKR